MKKIVFLVAGCFLFTAMGCTNQQTESSTELTVNQKMLRHVVLFKFKDTSSAEDVQSVADAFRNLPSAINEIKDFEWGTNNSPEGLADGFTHAFFVSFESEADREVYLPHPKHQEFVEILKPHLDKVLVVDYWAEK